MALRESRLQALMWMVFLAGLGAFIAGQTLAAALAVLAVAAIAFSGSQSGETTTITTAGSKRSKQSTGEELVSSN